jgi:hypothetical protein
VRRTAWEDLAEGVGPGGLRLCILRENLQYLHAEFGHSRQHVQAPFAEREDGGGLRRLGLSERRFVESKSTIVACFVFGWSTVFAGGVA